MRVEAGLDALFARWDRADAPGFAVGVAVDGVPVYRRGFGLASVESGVKITPSTRMRIGSISKHFTALLALLFAEEGRIDLDVPIQTYLPELDGPGGHPSIRHYLEHRGGQRCYLDVGYLAHGRSLCPPGYALEIQARQRETNFPPGAAMIYNNGGYHLVSRVLERVGEKDFPSLLAQWLLEPLDLRDTSCLPSDYVLTPGLATQHAALPEGQWRRGLFPSEENLGEGGIVSSVDDMLAWAAHLRSRDRFGTARTWESLLETPCFPDGSSSHYALGLMRRSYRGTPTVEHAGGMLGAAAQLLTLPEHGLDIVVLANRTPEPNPVVLAEMVADLFLEDVLGPRETPLPAKDWSHLEGNWWSPETTMLYSLHADGDALQLGVCGAPQRFPLYQAEPGRAATRPYSLGTITLDLASADRSGVLPIDFGGVSTLYRKLDSAISEPVVADTVAGRYRCEDADCITEIASIDGTCRMRCSDSVGSIVVGLHWASPCVALSRPLNPTDNHFHALGFAIEGGVCRHFTLNGVRNRNLRFIRCERASSSV